MFGSFAFFEDVEEYERNYEYALKPQHYVDRKVINAINIVIAKTLPGLYVSKNSVYSVTSSVFKSLVQKLVQPDSKFVFIIELKKNCKVLLPQNFELNVSTFKVMHDAVLAYSIRFVEVVKFMSEENDRENIPPLSVPSDEGESLIKVFTKQIPCGFGDIVRQQMPATKFKTLEDFISSFQEHLQIFLDSWEHSRVLQQAIGLSTKNFPVIQTDSSVRHSTKLSSLDLNEEMLNNLDISEIPDEVEENILDVTFQKPFVTKPIEMDGEVVRVDASESALAIVQGSNESAAKKPFVTLPRGCFSHCFFGRCDKKGCEKPHDRATIQASLQQYMKLIKSHPFFVSEIMQRPSSSLNFIDSSLCASIGGKRVPKIMAQGKLICESAGTIDVKVLFDSGALHSSYMSKKFVNENRVQLKKFIYPVDSSVRLGDSHTTCMIEEVVIILILFDDAQALVSFYVFDTEIPVILGLPDIARHFIEIFFAIMSSVREELVDEDQHDVSTSDIQVIVGDLLEGDIVEPWSSPPCEELAPEDEMLDAEDDVYTILLNLNVPYQKQMDEFMASLEERVSSEMRQQTDILKLLTSVGLSVFLYTEWSGIKVPPVELNWKESLPPSMRARVPRLDNVRYEAMRHDIERLRTYMYEVSESPWASPALMAPKGAGWRTCGDYRKVNQHVEQRHWAIPYVRDQVTRAAGFSVFAESDLASAFHQIPIGPHTSNVLTVSTPFGMFRPKFMPEGVAPASAILQQVMDSIFFEWRDWCIVIFDNLLVCGHDYLDLYNKFEKVLHKCTEKNIKLKLSKSNIGVTRVKFFGYLIEDHKYYLDDERKQALLDIPFPKTVKQMQSFLGTAIYFQPFVMDYAMLAEALYQLTTKAVNIERHETWARDYLHDMKVFKKAITDSMALYFPDYTLEWVLQVDASGTGTGGWLYQNMLGSDGVVVRQAISFFSKKSSQALAQFS